MKFSYKENARTIYLLLLRFYKSYFRQNENSGKKDDTENNYNYRLFAEERISIHIL